MKTAVPEATDPPEPPPPAAAPKSAVASGLRYHGVFLAMAAAVLTLSIFFQLGDTGHVEAPRGVQLPKTCTWRNVTGMGCPGCGLTRCFVAMAHFDVASAWRFNPAGILAFGFLLFQFPFRGIQIWRIRRGMKELQLPRAGHLFVWVMVIALFAQWFVRMAMGVL